MTADKEIFFSNYDYYWLKYTMDRGIEEQARYLVAGHSLARFGINDRDIPGLINLAFLSFVELISAEKRAATSRLFEVYNDT